MKALGDVILIQMPTKKTETEGGLVLPDTVGGSYSYGRIVSVGEKVTNAKEGEFVAFDAAGQREIMMDPMKDDGLVAIDVTMLYARYERAELEERKLPIP